MTPNSDERLASVIRALTDVVLPALPPEAGLAQEQVQLSIGQLQILRAQLDSVLSYEADELADAAALGGALTGICKGGAKTGAAVATLTEAVEASKSVVIPAAVRDGRIAIHAAIDAVVGAVSADGDDWSRSRMPRTILEAETKRAVKDRRWYQPFGFDIAPLER